MMARSEFVLCNKITTEAFVNRTIQKVKKESRAQKSMEMHKSSARGLEEAISSLKGKKLQLYQKKAEKQALY